MPDPIPDLKAASLEMHKAFTKLPDTLRDRALSIRKDIDSLLDNFERTTRLPRRPRLPGE